MDRKLLEKTGLKSLIRKQDWSFIPTIDKIHYPTEPSPYDVLSCLTKQDPNTFRDFCSDFGCNKDSRIAKRTFKAVKKEYAKVCGLWNEKELEELGKIQ